MKRILLASLASLFLLAGCKKDKDEAKSISVIMNGQATTLTLQSATLSRSQDINARNLSITVVTPDQEDMITLQVILPGAQGNTVDMKSYGIGQLQGSLVEAAASHMKKTGNAYGASSYTGTSGEIVITRSEGSTVSGTFAVTLTDLSVNPKSPIVLKEGKFENVKFSVQN